MRGFVVLLSLLSAVTLAGSTGKNVYRIAVFPRDVRVRALAHLRAARNVGFSLGALAGGVDLAIGTRAAITSIPLATGAVLILNAVMVARLPSVERQTHPAPSPGHQLTVAPPAWRNRGFVVLSCLVISVTHETVGWVSIMLIWLGHVTITGAALWQSASDWGFQSELSDHRRLGDYQGVWSLGYQVGPVIFPGLYTFLALQWGAPGWAVIAVLAAVAAHPAAHSAQRFLERAGSGDDEPADFRTPAL